MSAYNVKGDLPKEKLAKRKVILDELLSTEESYVMDIHTLNKIFLGELQSEENAGVISGSVVKRIFGNIDLVLRQNSNFLTRLRTSLHGNLSITQQCSHAAQCLMDFAPS